MRRQPAKRLATWKKMVLALAGVAAVAVPVVSGSLSAEPLREPGPALIERHQHALARVLLRLRRGGAPGQSGGQRFEVAAIKPNKSGGRDILMRIQPGGRMDVTNATLRILIRNAYRLQDSQIVGGPNWINSDRFDIVAKAEGNPTQEELTAMLRSLMFERFKLTVHNETRELPIYALVAARSDRKLGPHLGNASLDCSAARSGPPVEPGKALPCGFRVRPGHMTAQGVVMPALAWSLSNYVQRVVLDRTGLTGEFDLKLEWTPDQMPFVAPGTAPPGAPPPPPADGPSIFTALQEQLGLKLESQRGPVDVLVIDGAEPPTPD